MAICYISHFNISYHVPSAQNLTLHKTICFEFECIYFLAQNKTLLLSYEPKYLGVSGETCATNGKDLNQSYRRRHHYWAVSPEINSTFAPRSLSLVAKSGQSRTQNKKYKQTCKDYKAVQNMICMSTTFGLSLSCHSPFTSLMVKTLKQLESRCFSNF